MTIIIAIIIAGALIVYGAVAWGIVFLNFWEWFVLPVFPEMPILTLGMAIGLSFFISLFHARNYTMIKDDYQDKISSFALLLISPWVTLLIGSIAHGMIY